MALPITLDTRAFATFMFQARGCRRRKHLNNSNLCLALLRRSVVCDGALRTRVACQYRRAMLPFPT